MRHRVGIDLSYARLIYAIPIFQRRFEISVEKINRSQKIVAVRIMRVEPQGAAQIDCCSSIVLLFKFDPGELKWKSLVPGLLAGAGFERVVRFLPVAELCQRCAVIETQIS